MKAMRIIIPALATVALGLGLATSAYAFHSGGVAECAGCHSMHSSFPGGSSLLVGGDASATCLACHQHAGDTGPSSYHISTAEADMAPGFSPLQRTPGGDFDWLKKNYTWTGRGNPPPIIGEAGQTHGHNIVATAGYFEGVTVNYNYLPDSENSQSPGGNFPATDLTCTSCHDPHGQSRRLADGTIMNPDTPGTTSYLPISASGSYTSASSDPVAGQTAVGVYRLLGGPTYGVFASIGAPAAIAPSTYNQTEATNQVKVAYGRSTLAGNATWGEWCGACHQDMHQAAQGAGSVHPVDEVLDSTIKANYNKYVKTGDLSATSANSYTSLVPVIYDISNYDTLQGLAGNGSPTYAGLDATTNGRVDCLSCHRAHASAWEYAMRWNPEYEFLTDASGNYYNGGYGGRGRTTAEVEDSYYDRPSTVFAKSQRSLCNKCHIQD
jgi:hypothetical protein